MSPPIGFSFNIPADCFADDCRTVYNPRFDQHPIRRAAAGTTNLNSTRAC